MPKFSIIVPVYKTEHYLNACVESVLLQTFSDFELILVDDGSPDDCPAMCDAWASKQSRFRVIHKPNGGLSSARNAGLAAAQGEYILFLDSDDTLRPDTLEELYAAMHKHPVDILSFGINILQNGFVTEVWSMEPFFCKDLAELKPYFPRFAEKLFGCAVNKLYSADFFQRTGVQFDETVSLSEDADFAYMAYAHARAVANIPNAYYDYWHHENLSITRAGRTDLLEVWRKRLPLLERFLLKAGYSPVERDAHIRASKQRAVYNQYIQAISAGTQLSAGQRYSTLKCLLSDAEYRTFLHEQLLHDKTGPARFVMLMLVSLRAAALMTLLATLHHNGRKSRIEVSE